MSRDLHAFRDFFLQKVDITIISCDKASRKEWKIAVAEASLVLRHIHGREPDIMFSDTIRRGGTGAYKDVFFFDTQPLVLKLMLGDASKNRLGWPHSAAEEQGRYDKYKERVGTVLMLCFGQVFLNAVKTPLLQSQNVLRGDTSLTEGHASVTLAEQLITSGKQYVTELFTTQVCDAHNWLAFAKTVMEILKVLMLCAFQDVIPWDAKLDNVGLARPRTAGGAPSWVACDLDGFRDREPPYSNAGGSMRKILRNMMSQDSPSVLAGKVAQVNGWSIPFEAMYMAIEAHIGKDDFGQCHQTLLGCNTYILCVTENK